MLSRLSAVVLLCVSAIIQGKPNELCPSNNIQVPTACSGSFKAGVDQVLHVLPYRFSEVLDVIGDFQNLTWSGNPPSTVRLNGTNNALGTARFYSLSGIAVVETLTHYLSPARFASNAKFKGHHSNGYDDYGPKIFIESHSTAQIDLPEYNISAYIPFDGNMAYPVCDGSATLVNLTAYYCATDTVAAGSLLHTLHLNDAVNIGRILGGATFTCCEELDASSQALQTGNQ